MQTIYKTTQAARSIFDTADELRAAFGEPYQFAVFNDEWSSDVFAIYLKDGEDELICSVADSVYTSVSCGFPYGGGFSDLDVTLREVIYPYNDEPDYSDVISSIVFASPEGLADLISLPVAI